jgi:hypothetical protein
MITVLSNMTQNNTHPNFPVDLFAALQCTWEFPGSILGQDTVCFEGFQGFPVSLR